MYIPFGENKPNEKQTALLLKLGFDLSKMKQEGKYYLLEVPGNAKIHCTNTSVGSSQSLIQVNYNGINVIDVVVKTAYWDSKCYFNIREDLVEKALAALAMPKVATAERIVEEVEEEDPTSKLTEYQKRLAHKLSDLMLCCSGEGGYTSYIARNLKMLQDLKKENPKEHDQLINSNELYKNCLKLFPNWVDVNHYQEELQNKLSGRSGPRK